MVRVVRSLPYLDDVRFVHSMSCLGDGTIYPLLMVHVYDLFVDLRENRTIT